jgi:heptosyltransferase-2
LFGLVPGVDEVVASDRPPSADLAVLFPNSFASAWAVRRAGIVERWGYAADLRRPLLSRAVRRPGRSMHQGAYYQHLVRELGIANGPLEPRIEVPATAMAAARELLESRGWDGLRPLLVIAPGAAYGTAKRWLPSHFARMMAGMHGDGITSVLVGSSGDAPTAAAIVQSTAVPVIDLTGATSLEILAGVMRLAAACVSNDSGAMHLAGAVGVPLAALFGPTREQETAPLVRAGARSTVLINPVWCRPCMLRECPIDHRCMRGLAPERVAAAVRLLMGGTA